MDVDKSPVDQAAAADTTKPGGQIRARDGAESSPEKKRPDRRATPTKMKVTMASSCSVAPPRPPNATAIPSRHCHITPSRLRRCRLQTHSFTTHPSHQPGDQAVMPLAADWLELEDFTDELLGDDQEQTVAPPPLSPPPPPAADTKPCEQAPPTSEELVAPLKEAADPVVQHRLDAAKYAEEAAEAEEAALEAEAELEEREGRRGWHEAIRVFEEATIDADDRRLRADNAEAELVAACAKLDLARAEYEEGVRLMMERQAEQKKLLQCASRAKAPPAPRTGDSNALYAATLPELSGVRCLLLLSEHAARSRLSC